jgi:hypothetical protein
MGDAKHFDDGKLALQNILAMPGLDEVAKVGMYGAKKYGQWNYRGGSDFMRYLGSVVRHVTRYIRGESVDAESGLSHLAHAIYNLLILLGWELEGVGNDDRPCAKLKPLSPSDNSSLPF